VQATVETAVPEDVWVRSLDDRLIDYQTGVDLDGYVWGVKWQELYPGARLVTDSGRTGHWSQALGLDFHEVTVETNGHNLTLVFSDLEVTEVVEGYSQFTVGTGGPDFKIPLA
jgi:hypothetical protein